MKNGSLDYRAKRKVPPLRTKGSVSMVNDRFKKDIRPFIVIGCFTIAFIVLLSSVFDIQIIRGEELVEIVTNTKTRTITVPGSRGEILDVNGIPLAVDQKSFKVEFYREFNTAAQRETYTNSIILAIDLLKQDFCVIENSFAISVRDNGGTPEYYFNWGNVSEETAQKRENRWRQDFYFDINEVPQKTPEQMYRILRERYCIPEDMNDETAFQVLAIWQDSIQNYYYAKSIVIAQNLTEDTISRFESYSHELPGFSVTESASRIYPQYETAAHIVGYLGRISSENANKYVNELGYSTDDYVGVYGIEQIMESYLTGNGSERSGKRVVETTTSGTILRELSYTAPLHGDNVYLTIDINMQKIAQAALEENINAIYEEQIKRYNSDLVKYQKIEAEIGRPINMAQTGAAVVMEVDTGAVLALVSYPSYDPNIFSSGITAEQLSEIFQDKRGLLVNKAISGVSPPGSVFKMVVGAAGLMEGKLEINEQIEDLGEFKKYVEPGFTGPRCWRWRSSHKTHGKIVLTEALMHSCNYFFYEVADRLGIEKIRTWAKNFGLMDKTNIELSGEVKGQVGNQATLYDVNKSINNQETSMAYIVFRSIKNTINDCAKKSNVTIDETRLDEAILRMMQMISLPRKDRLVEIRSILVSELGLKRTYVDYEVKFHVSDYIEELIWTPIKTVNTGIGQGITTVTPIAVARYISSIVNGGTVYDAHVVDKVVDSSGKTVYKTEPTVFNQLGIKEEYLLALKAGMKDVVSGEESSTANKYFADFKYKNEMGGKTGTAQVNTIDIENNSWFVAFAPYDKPEIAIVVFIPNGYAGAMSSNTVKAIAQYYLDLKYTVHTDKIPTEDEIYN